MQPKRSRQPSSANGSPLSPPAAGSDRAQPHHPGPTSPLAQGSAARSRQPHPESPIAAMVKKFSETERIFLAYDFESVSDKPKKLDYYNIIFCFNPGTKSRPGHKKEDLKKVFLDNVRPILQPYLLPPIPTAMDTDASQPDFDPLSRKTTRGMLINAIQSRDPKANIPSAATIDDILIAYKYYVDSGLNLPKKKRFVERPRTVPLNRLKDESMEDILLALRYLAPPVFVRSLGMNKGCLVDLYTHFVHDKAPSSPLIPGFHYTLLKITPSDFVETTMSNA